MEGLALTGAWTDKDAGLISTIVLEMGGSSDLCAQLKPGEPVILMGPTGHSTEIPEGETVLLIGGGLGNAVLFSIGQAMRAKGCRVIYFAGYKHMVDRYKVEEIERAADTIVWCCDEAPGFTPDRPGDMTFVGNIVEAMDAYGKGALGAAAVPLGDVNRIIAIGSDGMMNAVARARHGVLAGHLDPAHKAIGSINSPMQCMMKEICAQCLQTHKDPATGIESVVFSCFNQDQSLDKVHFANLRDRLSQNGVQEKLTRLWIDKSLKTLGLRAPLRRRSRGGPPGSRRDHGGDVFGAVDLRVGRIWDGDAEEPAERRPPLRGFKLQQALGRDRAAHGRVVAVVAGDHDVAVVGFRIGGRPSDGLDHGQRSLAGVEADHFRAGRWWRGPRRASGRDRACSGSPWRQGQ